MHAHLVFVTKYRKTIFQKKHLQTLREIFEKICKDFDAELKEFNGDSDHVHLLVEYPPNYWKNALWSPSYFAGSRGGASLDIIKHYIEKQKPATSLT